jgi:hypothetical protein
MKLRMILFAILLGGFAVAAQAQTATPKVTERQEKQKKRIKEGVNSGELTAAETAQLKRQQRNIKRSKKAAKADGDVTAAERAKLHRQENRASRNIHRKKNNARDRN